MKSTSRSAAAVAMAVAIVMSLLPAAAAASGTGGRLTGRVTTGEGERLPGASVTLTSPALDGARLQTTNGNGDFRFVGLPPGEYKIKIELVGMKTVEDRVDIKGGVSTSLKVELALAEISEEPVKADAPTMPADSGAGDAPTAEPPVVWVTPDDTSEFFQLDLKTGAIHRVLVPGASVADPGPPRVTVFQRQRADGANSLGIGYDGPAIDSLGIGLPLKVRLLLEPGSISPEWKYEVDEGAAGGPAVTSVRLRLDAGAGVRLPGRLKVEARRDDKRVFGGKVEVESWPAVDPSTAPELGLPSVIESGRPFYFRVPAGVVEGIGLSYGGQPYAAWRAKLVDDLADSYPVYEIYGLADRPPDKINGLPWWTPNGGMDPNYGVGDLSVEVPSDTPGEPYVGLAPADEATGPMKVTAVDAYGETVYVVTWEPQVLPQGFSAGPPAITGVSDFTFAGQPLCVCGRFPGAAILDRLQIGGRGLGPAKWSSPFLAVFDTPRDLAPGAHGVGWSPEYAAGIGGPFDTEVIEFHAAINDEVIQKGGTTGLEMEIVGTDKPVHVELENKSPGKITMAPENRIDTQSTGGAENLVPGVTVTGLERGTYSIEWNVDAGTCPFEEGLQTPVDYYLRARDRILAAAASDDPAALLSWLQDPDGDGIFGFSIPQAGFEKVHATDPAGGSGGACGGTMELLGGRFRVEATWPRADGSVAAGECERVGGNAGILSIGDPEQWALIEILDGCDFNNSFWVFAAGATDVEYTLTVTDTQTGSVQNYDNRGWASSAITDTSAFATCP